MIRKTKATEERLKYLDWLESVGLFERGDISLHIQAHFGMTPKEKDEIIEYWRNERHPS